MTNWNHFITTSTRTIVISFTWFELAYRCQHYIFLGDTQGLPPLLPLFLNNQTFFFFKGHSMDGIILSITKDRSRVGNIDINSAVKWIKTVTIHENRFEIWVKCHTFWNQVKLEKNKARLGLIFWLRYVLFFFFDN